jgi:hypothetical protein
LVFVLHPASHCENGTNVLPFLLRALKATEAEYVMLVGCTCLIDYKEHHHRTDLSAQMIASLSLFIIDGISGSVSRVAIIYIGI